MRSYWSHLQSLVPEKNKDLVPKPIFRTSAIFPVFKLPGISSRILYMGYWILKRNIKEIGEVLTLRTLEGKELYRTTQQITSPKCYRVEVDEILKQIGHSGDFTGTLEVEFYASTPLVFPFPAVVINYYGPNFSSVVHTAQRVYNDFDDLRKNSESAVPESGFNIYADEDHEPFISLINGCEPTEECTVQMQFFNLNKETLSRTLHLGTLAPYEARIIYPGREVDLRAFLHGKVGAGKIEFHLNWVFPRLVVGNLQKSKKAMVITHTYYDLSRAMKESDYWRPTEAKWHPASLMVPVMEEGFTNIYFYPIYSRSELSISIEFYDRQGNCLGRAKDVLSISHQEFKCIRLKELASQIGVQSPVSARVICDSADRIPARIKIALDIGMANQMLPCNICTNLHPFNPPMETKPKTFRWLPLLADQPRCSAWIVNSSPAVDFKHEAQVELTFFREADDQTIVRRTTIPPHGSLVIRPEEDPEAAAFLNNTIGWITATCTNPYTTSYYFAVNPSGIVGGDHGF